jgi:PPM family protein phosphatase
VSGPGTVAEIRTASESDVGRARRDNQDAVGEFASREGERLLVVADGMGGHVGGATASRICVETLGAALVDGDGGPEERLRRGLTLANARIREAAERQPELAGMGTTAVALLFGTDGRAWLGWVGDSRAYRARGGEVEALSSDHSVVAEWVRAGILRADEAEQHPRRNELLRALGASDQLEPELRELEVRAGDRFLLCSDGLSAVVPLAEISAVFALEAPELAVKKLVAMANERGGPDNVTAVVAEVPEHVAPAASAAAPRRAAPSRALRGLFAVIGAVALGLLGAILYGLANGGGGLPEVAPVSAPATSHAEVLRFLDEWTAAANAHDASHLRALGFELTPEELERNFPRGGKLDLVLLSEQPLASDLVGLRLRLVYTYSGRGGVERSEEDRALLLRASGGTLHYEGIWE